MKIFEIETNLIEHYIGRAKVRARNETQAVEFFHNHDEHIDKFIELPTQKLWDCDEVIISVKETQGTISSERRVK